MDSGLYLPQVSPLVNNPLANQLGGYLSLEPHPDTNTRIIALSEKDLALILALFQYIESGYNLTYNVVGVPVDNIYDKLHVLPELGSNQIPSYPQYGSTGAKTDLDFASINQWAGYHSGEFVLEAMAGGVGGDLGGFQLVPSGAMPDTRVKVGWYASRFNFSPKVGSVGWVLYHNGNSTNPSGLIFRFDVPKEADYSLTMPITRIGSTLSNIRVVVNSDKGKTTQNYKYAYLSSNPAIVQTGRVSGGVTIQVSNTQGGSSALRTSWYMGLGGATIETNTGIYQPFLLPDKRVGRWEKGELIGEKYPVLDVRLKAIDNPHIMELWGRRIDQIKGRLMVDLTPYLQDIQTALETISEHNERLADASERIATALEAQASGEGLEDIAGAITALAPLLAG